MIHPIIVLFKIHVIAKISLEVIKFEFILNLKIMRVRKQLIIVLYFEFKTVLKFYNLEA